MRWIRLSFLAPLCVASVAVAHEEPVPEPAPTQRVQQDSFTGFYAGLGGHYGLPNFDIPSALETDDSGGLNARLGYRTSPTLAAELRK